MFRMLLIIIYIFVSCVGVFARNEVYSGHRVYNIRFENEKQQERLDELKHDMVDFWRKPNFKYNVTGRAMVSPLYRRWFERRLADLSVEIDIYVDDVSSYLNEKEATQESPRDGFDFVTYHRYNEILDYMKSLESQFANSNNINVTYVEADVTDEGRPLVYLEVTSLDDTDTEKPVAVVEAGIIPREWITVPAALNIVNELVEQTELLRGLKWIVIPVLNPDGYEYTHTNLRLWSKSRSQRSNLGFICPGVNLNRNFDIDWLFSDTSTSPCSHLYGGVEPFSEPETKMIQNLIQEYGERIKMYITLQNGGGFVAYPWHYERAASGMFRQHHLLGREMVQVLGNEYILDIGSLAAGDRASGTSADYAMSSDVIYTFNINIDGEGDDGVMIPEGDIIPIVDKIWRAVSLVANTVIAS